jgi:translation initiation factor IF-3
VTLQFRGREMAHTDLGRKVLDKLAKDLEDMAKVESAPRQEGRFMVMMLSPLNTKKASKPAKKVPSESSPVTEG